MSNIFFTSDTHFHHNNVIKYCNRPFLCKEEMNEHMIEEWNKIVGVDDFVYHLGDFSFAPRSDNEYILSVLNGKKILVAGNHDDKRVRGANGWEHVCNELTFQIAEYVIRCSHFPSWKESCDHDIFLHGHCHATLPPTINVMDVGVDMAYKLLGSYRPFSLDEVVDELIRIESLFRDTTETTTERNG